MSKYNKAWMALASLALTVVSFYFSDASWLPFVVQAAGVFGVYTVRNSK